MMAKQSGAELVLNMYLWK